MPGLHKYFKKCSYEERTHAELLMEYMNKRGGHIVLADIAPPEKSDWGHAQDAMQAALDLERKVNDVCLLTSRNLCHIKCFTSILGFVKFTQCCIRAHGRQFL